MSEELAGVKNELEKQRVLTEKLENDLMNIGQGQPNGVSIGDKNTTGSGIATPNQSMDGLAGLNLGSTSVSNTQVITAQETLTDVFDRTNLSGTHRSHSHLQLTRPFCPL